MQFEGVDKVIKSKRRSIALEVSHEGLIILRVPKFMPMVMVKMFLNQHKNWLNDKKADLDSRKASKKKFIEGEMFCFMGEEYPLSYVDGKNLELDDTFKLGKEAKYEPKVMFERWYKEEFRKLAEDRLAYYAALGNYKYKKLRVSGARGRWGSRSTTGTISLVWRLIMFPLEIIDYVVLHELAHTVHMNHSQAFWSEVEQYMPDYKKRRKWLKENGGKVNYGW